MGKAGCPCCAIRKVAPLAEALRPYQAWISGIRREQTAQRAAAEPVARKATWRATPSPTLSSGSGNGKPGFPFSLQPAASGGLKVLSGQALRVLSRRHSGYDHRLHPPVHRPLRGRQDDPGPFITSSPLG
ncbi:MAG: phosphoadenosine phosphosulfate reductase family protein [Chloroflexaceae bacterium]